MASIEDLDEGLLHDILCRLDSHQKRCVAPLVSKRWAALVTQPGVMWQQVIVDLRQQAGAVVRSLAQKWFAKRALCLQSIVLLTLEPDVDICADITAVLGGPQLGGPQSGLAHFSANLGGPVPSAFLASLSWLRQLQVLRLVGMQGPITVMQLQPLSRLQHLKALELAFEGRRQQLNGFPDVIAGLMKLESLHFKGAGEYAFRKLPSRLSRLEGLRVLSFVDCGAHALRSNMTNMTSLESLTITDHSPPRLLKLPRKMSAMEALVTVDVSSRDVPISLGTLPNLKHLTLRALKVIHGSESSFEEAFALLLENLSLRELQLLSCNHDVVPHAVTLHCYLEKLVVRNGLVSDLPPGPYLDRQGCLRELDLSGCCFSCVPEEALSAPWLKQLTMIEGRPLDLNSLTGDDNEAEAGLKAVMDLEMQLLDIRMEYNPGVVLEA